MPGIHTILHPTDFSENSRPAFQTACALARDAQATLLVLHVMMPSSSPLIASAPPDPRVPAESQPTPTKLPWPEPSDPRIRVEHRLAEGDAAEEILRVSAAVPCDLIVMGTHGRTGLGRLLTGSVAEEVLRKADCPVMVVKTPLHATPGLGAETIASPGAVVDVRPLEQSLVSASTRTLIHTSQLEVIRLIVRAGQEINRRARAGETIIHCLEGRVTFTAFETTQTLEAGKLVDVPADEHYTFHGIEDSSLLLTIVVPRH